MNITKQMFEELRPLVAGSEWRRDWGVGFGETLKQGFRVQGFGFRLWDLGFGSSGITGLWSTIL